MSMTMPGAWWFYITPGVIEVVLSLLIFIHAWRWPRDQCVGGGLSGAGAAGLNGTFGPGVKPLRHSAS